MTLTKRDSGSFMTNYIRPNGDVYASILNWDVDGRKFHTLEFTSETNLNVIENDDQKVLEDIIESTYKKYETVLNKWLPLEEYDCVPLPTGPNQVLFLGDDNGAIKFNSQAYYTECNYYWYEYKSAPHDLEVYGVKTMKELWMLWGYTQFYIFDLPPQPKR